MAVIHTLNLSRWPLSGLFIECIQPFHSMMNFLYFVDQKSFCRVLKLLIYRWFLNLSCFVINPFDFIFPFAISPILCFTTSLCLFAFFLLINTAISFLFIFMAKEVRVLLFQFSSVFKVYSAVDPQRELWPLGPLLVAYQAITQITTALVQICMVKLWGILLIPHQGLCVGFQSFCCFKIWEFGLKIAVQTLKEKEWYIFAFAYPLFVCVVVHWFSIQS